MRTIKIEVKNPKFESLLWMFEELNFIKVIESITRTSVKKAKAKKWTTCGEIDLKGKLDNINIRNFAHE